MELSSREVFGDYVTEFPISSTQYDGVRWMQSVEAGLSDESNFKGGILADDMGLGKTRQFMALCEVSQVPLTLVVCTKSTLYPWIREGLNTAKSCNIYTFKDGKYALTAFSKSGNNNIVLTKMNDNFIIGYGNPAILILNYDLYCVPNNNRIINKSIWDRVGTDEAHSLRNGEQTTKYNMLSKINQPIINGHRVGSRFAITGTPIQNDEGDAVSIFQWIDPRSFTNTHNRREELRMRIRISLFRRNKNQVTPSLKRILKYPTVPPEIINVKIIFPETQLSNYLQSLDFEGIRQFAGNMQNRRKILLDELAYYITLATSIKYEKSVSLARNAALNEGNSLRFALASPYEREVPLILGNEHYEGTSEKVKAIIKILTDNPNESYVIFHRFVNIGKIVGDAIRQENLSNPDFIKCNVSAINGETDDKDRDTILIDNANIINNGGRSILISSIQSTSDGMNFQMYHNVMIIDQDFNPKVEQQSIYRVYRIGQAHLVKVWYLSTEEFFIKGHLIGVDTKIENIKNEKDPLSDIIEHGNAAWFFKRIYQRDENGCLVAGAYFGDDFENLPSGSIGGPNSVGPAILDTYPLGTC